MAFSISIETYTILEKQLGQEAARSLAVNLEKGMNELSAEVASLSQQKKIELRDEMSKELASKADLAAVRSELLGEIKAVRAELLGEMKALEARLDRKLTIYMVVILCAIFLTNQEAIAFLLRVLGVVK
ncbi:MAG: hypothetical protein MUF71_06135 [Candidatus Kapabacteria bacterium]|nr:hypothetical protein [Candidatus Kapabacteria bacterium]